MLSGGLLSLAIGWIEAALAALATSYFLSAPDFLIGFVLLVVAIVAYVAYVPAQVAKLRGFNGVQLKVIAVLGFCGLFVGLSWIVALALVFLWRPDDGRWIWEKETPSK
ncbi:MAG: hypothetical protein LBE89_00470 [Helicobacteraceae bacterium]|jgi:hypothetical protein|nr:hypothetical protein [Helicobacteraceae bacterium]